LGACGRMSEPSTPEPTFETAPFEEVGFDGVGVPTAGCGRIREPSAPLPTLATAGWGLPADLGVGCHVGRIFSGMILSLWLWVWC
jgi:hypothetical protein